MNEQTEKLIRELADKLGTTAEHIWGVLIRQARISGITDIIVIAGWTWLAWLGYRILKRKTTAPPKTEEDRYPEAEWEEEGAVIAWLVWGAGVVISVLVIGCLLSDIVGALLNPEYWALKQVIK